MEKLRWTDHVRNEEVLLRVNEQRNILHEMSKRKANWIGHILRRNCLLKQVIEGKIKEDIEVTGRRGRRRRNWIGHILRRNCLQKRVIEGKIKKKDEVTGRGGRRRKKLLDDLKERRGYCHLKEEVLDRTVWGAGFGRGFGPVVRQTV